MRRAVLLGAVVSMVAMATLAAAAARDCYSNADLEAELAIQFQAKLMVLSDVCRDTTYGLFTQRNKDAIIKYQKQLIDHFRRQGKGRADVEFENYMTHLANEEALASGQRTMAENCQTSALIPLANSFLTSSDMRAYFASQATANRAQYVACKE
ncbi:MAG TPA: hypothetical protein VMG55_03375 [Stellaceae bacterium]|nr:hypothetical protein [Stellaceae bacterium]